MRLGQIIMEQPMVLLILDHPYKVVVEAHADEISLVCQLYQ